jgi:hypothetical protein
VGGERKVMTTYTERRVCEDISRRIKCPILKYGTTVEGNPLELKEWVRHAYEEALDMAIYLRRILEKLEEGEDQT